ncbi:MAG TPA: hypothetical protein VIV07_04600 [Sphingomicrobium sp.]
MRKLPALALAGLCGLALAGTALAAGPATHVMNVPLPDGSTVRVEYVGNVAPKVTVAPRPLAAGQWAPMALPSFGNFDQMFAEMNRRAQEMARQAQQIARQPAGISGGPYVAAYGNLPQGSTSTSVVTVSNGSGTCTRTTEVVSQGAGKPPKVTTNVSGQCGPATAAPRAPVPPVPPPPPERLDHT